MPFEYRSDIAHADVAFDAWAPTLEELFREAARATMQVMVENPEQIRQAQTLALKLEQENEEMLLFDFLNELIFYKDARRLVLLPGEMSITPSDGGLTVRATLSGEEIDPTRHEMGIDVKAVTMLRYKVEQVAQRWQATVVLDV
ncbi:archease [Geomonas sp. Red69]|uniref:Archease n=1 Tax=Geomonas diazotrophica TaxID=2843197 RepID=A0ABX8JE71_9BACT|nr:MULTISPECIES: archease [Geomonas]MBU5638807.1 archease [Geomonas diazotrophica]QWV96603.1 archease [Geomonas nitrogeniifigens]QXE85705.1 archease [Geomonas nitrogeniifigens]